jgi:four helix bundle suffix protein
VDGKWFCNVAEINSVRILRELCEVVRMRSASAEPTARQAQWDSWDSCEARSMRKHRGFISPHGNYRELLSYEKSKVVHDVTFTFCRRFLTKGDRTIDQMIKAVRPGKQNILEGSEASETSKTNYLLDQQIRRLERDFTNEGGIRERMARVGSSVGVVRSREAIGNPQRNHRRSDP